VNGAVVEGVNPVHQAVFTHFKNHFRSDHVVRPTLGNLQFRQLSADEVKAEVYDCDSFKSPGPDGINFGFIKNFLHEMKDDILRFTS
jgi:hypothetical protein